MVVESSVSGITPEVFNWVEIWLLRCPWHMVYIISMLIKPFSDHSCFVDGGALSFYGGMAMVDKIMACPAFVYMTLSMMGC
jgi:hypothetical protein